VSLELKPLAVEATEMSNIKPFSRRQFLKLSATVAGSAALVSGVRSVFTGLTAQAAAGGALHTATEENIVPTVCLLCPGGCGMLARVADGNLVKVEGSPMHPINLGALCPKGQAAPELLYNPDRLTGPMRRTGERGAGQWEAISWDEAIQIVAEKLNQLRAAGTPERAAVLYGETRGQMRPLLERFMAAVGSPNVVSHESLNIAAAKLGTLLTQGVYDLPNYDLENAHYVLSFGANMLEAGRSPQRMVSGYAYMRRGRAERGKFVVLDPRQGITGAKADEWIPIKPGTDAALALSIANVIIKTGQFDSEFVNNYCFGFEDFKDDQGKQHKGFKNYILENYDPQVTENITGVPATTVSRIAGEFAGNPPAVAVLPGKGGLLNGSFNGVSAAMAIHSLNALVGNLDVPGGVLTQRYPSCTPWPDLPNDPVATSGRQEERVDGAGTVFPIGRQAYQAVAERVLDGYPLEALFLYDANPVFEVPSGEKFIQAFELIPLIVSFSSFMDETAQYADLVLPEPTFLERWQDDYIEGLGYAGIALRQPVVEPLYDTMNTGDFILKVAQNMDDPVAAAFPWDSFENLLQERHSGNGTDWETLKELGVWMIPGYRFARRGSQKWVQEVIGRDRQKSARDGRFDFYSRELSCLLNGMDKEQLEAMGTGVTGDPFFMPHYEPVAYLGVEEEYPFLLNVVTLMSLGPYSAAANLPSLQEISGMTVGERWKSWLEMNPKAAAEMGLKDGDMVEVLTPNGSLTQPVKLKVVKALRPDVVNLPYNQGHTAVGRFAEGRGPNGLEMLNPASEPFSGLAAFTNTRVQVVKA